MENEKKNYQENIHNEEYKLKYIENIIGSENMIYDSGREKESLNGYWNFCIDQYDSFLRAAWFKEEDKDIDGRDLPLDYDFEDWEKVVVPSCWNTEKPEYFYYEGSAIYTRTFKYINRGEKRLFIKFGAANYEAYIFLNKQIIGYHKGGSTPFYIEATKYMEQYNRLTVVVNNTRRKEQIPANNTDWYNYGGLYRDIEIIRLPETFIKNFRINLVKESNFKKIEAEVELSSSVCSNATLKIPELNINKVINVKDGKGYEVIECEPELWSPENPKLYDVEISCINDSIKEEIGFREISVNGSEIYLNGKNIFLKGISCHEESVINGKAIKDDEIIENIKLAKEMNCNYMRLAHYPHTEKTAKIADKMGIMLWEEIPVYWAIDFDNPISFKDAKNQLLELINRDRNRTSVIIWSVGNENADTDARLNFMKNLAIVAKEEDPTRLVSAACLVDTVENKMVDRLANYLDIIGINEYYGWYDPDFERLPKCFNNSHIIKPVIISEFGADARPNHRGTRDDLFTEDMQKDVYEKQIQTLKDIEYIKGMSPWILYDFRCPRRHNKFQRGYNLKGLLSNDKKHKKLAYFIMQQFYCNK
jgi:beta-glucuronidase